MFLYALAGYWTSPAPRRAAALEIPLPAAIGGPRQPKQSGERASGAGA